MCHVSTLTRVRLCPVIIYFVPIQVQSILNELCTSYFLKSRFWVHWTPVAPKIVRNLTILEFYKICQVSRFCERNPKVMSVLSSEIYKIFRLATYTIATIYRSALFFSSEKLKFSRVLHSSPLKRISFQTLTVHTITCICNSHLTSMPEKNTFFLEQEGI